MSRSTKTVDVVVLGAGAAGMMCAVEAGRRGRTVAVLDHAKAPGEKIRISGGGRCNFTNMHSGPGNFLSGNPHFAKSALKSYTAQDFIAWVEANGIAYHEKTLGQLFCDGSARAIIAMLTDAMAEVGVELRLATEISVVRRNEAGFLVETSAGTFAATSLVVATGGKSIPKMGATGFGYDCARQFGHAVTDIRPALVPFTWPASMAESWGSLSGISLTVRARCREGCFDEAMLMTHRGLSGPAMLQISSYWRDGDTLDINLLPDHDITATLMQERKERPRTAVSSFLSGLISKRLAHQLTVWLDAETSKLADLSNDRIAELASRIGHFLFIPGGTEGYRTAEVTLGGVDTDGLSQKTMESKRIPGLYFIGEVVDVTGHLGGHNFQWAWSSGAAAGRHA